MRAIITCIFIFLLSINIDNDEIEVIKDIKPIEVKAPETRTQEIFNELHILHPTFRNKVVMVIYECKKRGIDLRIVETYRTHERQDKLKRKKLSQLSGGCSKHQHYIAVDVVPMKNGIPMWHDDNLWKIVEIEANKQGLKTGRGWKSLSDPGHIEFPISIDSIHKLEFPDTVLIPLNF